jgi:hypothetical protein
MMRLERMMGQTGRGPASAHDNPAEIICESLSRILVVFSFYQSFDNRLRNIEFMQWFV